MHRCCLVLPATAGVLSRIGIARRARSKGHRPIHCTCGTSCVSSSGSCPRCGVKARREGQGKERQGPLFALSSYFNPRQGPPFCRQGPTFAGRDHPYPLPGREIDLTIVNCIIEKPRRPRVSPGRASTTCRYVPACAMDCCERGQAWFGTKSAPSSVCLHGTGGCASCRDGKLT